MYLKIACWIIQCLFNNCIVVFSMKVTLIFIFFDICCYIFHILFINRAGEICHNGFHVSGTTSGHFTHRYTGEENLFKNALNNFFL